MGAANESKVVDKALYFGIMEMNRMRIYSTRCVPGSRKLLWGIEDARRSKRAQSLSQAQQKEVVP